MATRWADLWSFATWDTIEDENVLACTVMGLFYDACHERVSYARNLHLSEYTFDDYFPYDDQAVLRFELNTGNKRDTLRIRDNIYPLNAVKTTSIKTTGTASSNSDVPIDYTLSEILTDEFGYGSGTLYHILDSGGVFGGGNNAIMRSRWLKQWFEVMNYPKYYYHKFDLGESPQRVASFEQLSISFIIDYYAHEYYENTAIFQIIDNYTASYITNDSYAETGTWTPPFSATLSSMYDYLYDTIATQIADDDNWHDVGNDTPIAIVSGGSANYIKNYSYSFAERSYDGELDDYVDGVYSNITVTINLTRFQMNNFKRPAGTDTFMPKLYFNGYETNNINTRFYENGSPTTNTNTTGTPHLQIVLEELTADVNSNYSYTIDSMTDFEFSPVADLTTGDLDTYYAVDEAGSIANENTINRTLRTLAVGSSWNSGVDCFYSMPNDADGNKWEYFTP